MAVCVLPAVGLSACKFLINFQFTFAVAVLHFFVSFAIVAVVVA